MTDIDRPRNRASRWAEVRISEIGEGGSGVLMPSGEARAVARLLKAAELGYTSMSLASSLVDAADKAEARAAAQDSLESDARRSVIETR